MDLVSNIMVDMLQNQTIQNQTIHIYIYVYVCVCVLAFLFAQDMNAE